ncbi:MAG: TIGR03862 family flavoprotein [Magnetospirillum sp.]|nr:TIGR03862 family flavoprotein [Magnetospirillum sp.]
MADHVSIIGGGPAGLMAAEMLAGRGHAVHLFDAMPSVGRKFLLAGKGGMNLTHAEPLGRFTTRYGERADAFASLLAAFGPEQVRAWAAGLGIDTFVGSSGRVFPADFKAAPLLRAWLRRLRELGVTFHMRHRWLGWRDGALRFAAPAGEVLASPAATVLALGGASWPQLGSDGGWVSLFGVEVVPLKPANCGFDVAWSEHFRSRFAGQPLKAVALSFGGRTVRGEAMISDAGIEGGAVYTLSAALRDAGEPTLFIDLKPDWSLDKLTAALARPRGSRSLATHLHRTTGLDGVALGLARELLGANITVEALKALPLRLKGPRPIAEAISTAGGIRFEALDDRLMLNSRPGVFAAGEMLDWEAPTGGYLLTGCFATGRRAGLGAAEWLSRRPSSAGP